jgi:hypothetical protein
MNQKVLSLPLFVYAILELFYVASAALWTDLENERHERASRISAMFVATGRSNGN